MFPFGVQIKGFIIGILFAYFVIPFIQNLIGARASRAAAPA